jgi:hypothetical protein
VARPPACHAILVVQLTLTHKYVMERLTLVDEAVAKLLSSATLCQGGPIRGEAGMELSRPPVRPRQSDPAHPRDRGEASLAH